MRGEQDVQLRHEILSGDHLDAAVRRVPRCDLVFPSRALTRRSPIGFGNDRCWLKETDGAVSESYIGLLAYGQR
jgi:hypothetical protein